MRKRTRTRLFASLSMAALLLSTGVGGVMSGDPTADGFFGTNDIICVARGVVGFDVSGTPCANDTAAMDVNCDGDLLANDIIVIAKLTVGLTLGAGQDDDGDKIHNGCDNCPNMANFDQVDSDQDGTGDACSGSVTCEPPCGADATCVGSAGSPTCQCDAGFAGDGQSCGVDGDGDGFAEPDDCDDSQATVNSDASEICDEIDNNCDGVKNEGVLNLCGICGPPPQEVCDKQDNDCDGVSDEDDVCADTQEAVLILDGLSSTLRRSFDQGNTWDVVGTLPLKSPNHPSITRIGNHTLYVATYEQLKEGNATLYDGPKVVTSEDGGFTWTTIDAWDQLADPKASSPVVCGHPNGNLPVYGTDNKGQVFRSFNGMDFGYASSWPATGPSVSCAVDSAGTLFVLDAMYCGGPEDPCAAFWRSKDGGLTMEPGMPPTNNGSGAGSVMAASRLSSGKLYVSGGEDTIWVTGTDGDQWSLLPASVPTGPKSIGGITVGEDETLYVATATSAAGGECNPANSSSGCTYHGGQFYVSSDQGKSWLKGPDWIQGGNGSGWLAMTTASYAKSVEPPAGGGEPARYWRLLQNSSGAPNWFVAEVELHEDAVGGFDATDAGGVADAAYYGASDPNQPLAKNAFDNNDDPQNNWALWYTSLCCTSKPIGSDWLSFDFGEGNLKVINKIRIKQYETDNTGIWMYTSLKVQSSLDGVTWTDEWVASDLPETGVWGESVRP